jgi:malonyl-CoA decarboxylase
MPHEPLIFVEVALIKGMATSLPDLLDHQAERIEATEADTAIFYSISNCQQGLAGVSLGDFLIKSVAEKLTTDLPNVQSFATLSPLPGFRRWVIEATGNHDITLTPGEARQLDPANPAEAEAAFASLIRGPVPDAHQPLLERAEPVLMRLAAEYLLNHRRGGRALDPVAHFHLSNGASIDRLNWLANPSAAGWERGLGMMVNYHYELRSIERNHDRYLDGGEITASDRVRRLLEPVEADSGPQ